MASRALSITPLPKKVIKTNKRVHSVRPTQTTISAEQFARLTVVQQIKQAFKLGGRMAAITGLMVGGFVPVATFVLAHHEVKTLPWLWVLVVGGLLYSALTVFAWAEAAFSSKIKAAGFVVLLEGVLTFVTNPLLSLAALGILVFVNAVSAACQLQVRKTTPETVL